MNIGPGDVVVCMDRNCGGAHSPAQNAGVAGRHYVVESVVSGPFHSCLAPHALHLVGLPTNNPLGRCGMRFRKIEAADEQFTETVRACQPAKTRQPA